MNWQHVLQNDFGADRPLRERVEALFAQQRDTWPALRDGEAALTHLHRKTLAMDGASIIVQMNPARRASTTAKTDAQSVAARRCFLCPENMPPEERGVAFEDLVIMPNPFPILPLHATIAAREHRPQELAGQVGTFLQLAAEIGPGLAALYNGPRCGASAPDHFHFQAARAGDIPLLAQVASLNTRSAITGHTSFGRNMLLVSGTDAAEIQADIERAIQALRTIEATSAEPMLNLLAHVESGAYRLLLFPRAAHRPTCYYRDGPERLGVSPAILEMCGILVTTEPADFERLDADAARAIYAEVSISQQEFAELLSRVA